MLKVLKLKVTKTHLSKYAVVETEVKYNFNRWLYVKIHVKLERKYPKYVHNISFIKKQLITKIPIFRFIINLFGCLRSGTYNPLKTQRSKRQMCNKFHYHRLC